jgi:hypothetical protein
MTMAASSSDPKALFNLVRARDERFGSYC